jgi:hypothetical protein
MMATSTVSAAARARFCLALRRRFIRANLPGADLPGAELELPDPFPLDRPNMVPSQSHKQASKATFGDLPNVCQIFVVGRTTTALGCLYIEPAQNRSASELYVNAISTYQSFKDSNSCPLSTTVLTVTFLCLKRNGIGSRNFREISAVVPTERR